MTNRMSSGTPLLNDYKREFFWKRFAQTVLGGPKLRLGFRAPAYVYLSQVIVFVLPVLIGGVFTTLAQYGILTAELAMYISGALMIICVLIIQITAAITKRKNASIAPAPLTKGKNVLSEEDEIDFESCCDAETILFTIPPKKYVVNIIFHAVLSGPVVGISTWYLLPSTSETLFGNIGATIMLYIFGWLTVCIAQYSLSVGPPPETAIYRATDSYELHSLTRPVYVIMCLSIHLLDQYLSGFRQANEVSHIIFCLLPVFWLVGLLPPVDALVLWLMEQTLVFLFGGSPMASDLRLFLMTLVSGVFFVVVYFIPSNISIVALIISAAIGYILSTDLGGLGFRILAHCCKNKESPRLEHSNSGFLWQWTWKEILFHLLMMAIVGALTAVINLFVTGDISDYMFYAMLGVLALEIILGDIQSVYIFFGLIRNCVFPGSVNESGVFRPAKKRLVIVGHIWRALVHFVAPFVMLVYLTQMLDFDSASISSIPVLNTMGMFRAFRWIWQSTQCSLLELIVLHAVQLITTNSTWTSLGVGVQLLIISAVRNRAALILDKLYFWFTLTIKSWSDPKQRRKSTAGLIACNFILFPLILVVICASAVLAAPLFPLFTVPLFFIGYPRPLRFWPGTPGVSQNMCGDTVYYEQVAPQVARAFRQGFTAGSIGDARPGHHYLVRFQDRLVWVQVLERGYSYCTLSIKGMELQETSCHTTEATRVDDIIEETFEAGKVLGKKNNYPLHTVRPYDVRHIKAYSDAKNQLTGVIDSPDTLKSIKSSLVKTLIWVFLEQMRSMNKDSVKIEGKKESLRSQNGTFAGKNVSKVTPRISDTSFHEDNLSPRKSIGRPQSAGERSVKSFCNSLWSDDNDSLLGDFDTNQGNKINLLQQAANHSAQTDKKIGHLPPVENKSLTSPAKSSKKQEDIDNLFEELEFGLPVTDVNTASKRNDMPAIFSNAKHSTSNAQIPSYKFSSMHSHKFALPAKWTQVPLDEGKLRLLCSQFEKDWFKHVILLFESESQSTAQEIAEDEELQSVYSRVLMVCYAVLYDLGLSGNDAVSAGPSHVYKVYKGDIPWSVASDWITDDKLLLTLVLKAFRYAVKLSIDQMLLGEATSNAEITEYLQEYDEQWYIGTEKEALWKSSIAAAKPQLFSLSYDTEKSMYTSRVLTVQDTPIYISSLNPESVHAQWANLNVELLYMTNDDEERYSIQAHPVLLRNLNVQAANPPLGYPIYASEPVSVPIL